MLCCRVNLNRDVEDIVVIDSTSLADGFNA